MPAGLWGSRRAITVSDGTRIVTARRMRRRYTQQKAISKLLQYSHTQTCIHIDIHIHTHTYTRMHTHAYISIYTICVYMYVHACRRNAMYAFMHACTSACMHDCGVYVYIYICAHTYTQGMSTYLYFYAYEGTFSQPSLGWVLVLKRALWSRLLLPPSSLLPPPFRLLPARGVLGGLRSAQLSPTSWAPGRSSGGVSHGDHFETSPPPGGLRSA